MAYTKRTIVRMMLETSGVDPKALSTSLGEDDSYIDRIISGDVKKVTPNKLALIAKQCGYELAFVRGDEVLHLALVDIPREYREIDGLEEAGENKYTGAEISVTGALYGYTPDAQKDLLDAIGATWVKRVKTRSTNYLIIGSDIQNGEMTGQMERVINAKKSVTKMITAEEFRQDYLAITGRDIAIE